MKAILRPALLLAACMAGILASEAALAHGGGRARLSVGLHFGAPLYWHPWPSYYYYPPPVYVAPTVIQAQPPVYVERHDPPVTDQQGWWYYCDSGKGYYPYVKECPGGWRKVPPAPQ